MAEHITGFKTAEGVKKYDYNSLANKPEIVTNDTITKVAGVTELADTQKLRVFGGDFSGTTYVFAGCNIPAGTYTLQVDRIDTTDTDADTCQINFVKNNVVIRAGLYQRNVPTDATIDLPSDIDTVRMYASKGYNESVGDTFTVYGLKILKDTTLNQRLTALEQRGASRLGSVTLRANNWVGTASPYSQVVTIAGVTENSRVDLAPDVNQLAIFHQKDLAFVTENEDGVVTVYAIGDKPTNDYTIQATITEVTI